MGTSTVAYVPSGNKVGVYISAPSAPVVTTIDYGAIAANCAKRTFIRIVRVS
jgi:hypothetical protein